MSLKTNTIKDRITIRYQHTDTIQNAIIISILLVAIVIFSSISNSFFSFANFHSVLLTAVPVALIAIGECVCIMAGYFDMSVGMVASFAGLFAGRVMLSTGSVLLAVLVGMLIGLASGFVAGIAVSLLNMNAFITTFALQQIYRGLIFIWTEGLPQPLFRAEFSRFTSYGQLKVLGAIQFPIVVMLVIYLIATLFMKYTRTGRQVYLLGHNYRAAYISGININSMRIFVFMLCGVLSAIAGILFTMRVASAQPFVGDMYAMEAIAATIVGGTSMAGGKGNLAMTLVGVLIVYVIKNGLILVGLPDFYQYSAIGIILYLAVYFQVERKRV